MPTQIKVPDMGESVTEGTIARWFKQIGDAVALDEPLVEVETDKVTVEIPAPAAGTLTEISAAEGADVEVGAVIGAIAEGEAPAEAPAKGNGANKEDAAPAPAEAPAAEAPQAAEAAPAAESQAQKAPAAAPATESAEAPSGEIVDIAVPDMGESVTEGTVGRWLKQVGDSIAADEPVVEIETDKVTAELPAPAAGTLAEIIAAEGTDVEVGTIVGRIATGGAAAAAPGTAAKQTEPAKAKATAEPTPTAAPAPAPSQAPAEAKSDYPLAPAVRKLVDEHGFDPAQIPASGKDGRLTKGDVLAYIEGGGKAAPAAKTAAKAPAAAPARPTPAAPGFVPAAELPERAPDPRGEERVRMTKLRQTVATRLKEAQNTAAMLTTFNEIDMSAVMEMRAEYRDDFEKKHGVRLGFMSFFVKAAVSALKELPAVNGEIYGDEIIYKNYYDIGIAVGGPQGLVVPVLRDADQKSFAEIEKTIGDFGARARDGKLTLAELTGGTFTITNGGIFGSMLSTPILNPPQSGILGMHNIVKRAVVVDDEIVARPMMYVALSYDHRIVDGREAVTFLVRVKQAIEDPQRLLVGL